MHQSKKESKSSSEVLGKRSEPSSISPSENEKSLEQGMNEPQKQLKVGFEGHKHQLNQNRDKNGQHQMSENIQNGQQPANNFMRLFMPQPYMQSNQAFAQPVPFHQQNQQNIRVPQQNPEPPAQSNFQQMDVFRNFPISLMLTEMRAQSQMILGMKEKIDSLYKLLSFFIKDYQVNK